jgi:hypothetical protein
MMAIIGRNMQGLNFITKTLLHLMEFNHNFTYMLQSATVEDNVYHEEYYLMGCDAVQSGRINGRFEGRYCLHL